MKRQKDIWTKLSKEKDRKRQKDMNEETEKETEFKKGERQK